MPEWRQNPQAFEEAAGMVSRFLSENDRARGLASRIEEGTSTRFMDWIDHLRIGDEVKDPQALIDLGWVESGRMDDVTVLRHTASTLFPVLSSHGSGNELYIHVENLDEFARTNDLRGHVQGQRLSPCRCMTVSEEGNSVLYAIERRGHDGFSLEETDDLHLYQGAILGLLKRNRERPAGEGLADLRMTFTELLKEISQPRLADAFFRAERQYWAHRCPSGTVQKARQDRLGLGLTNTDHHTYRCSREHYRTVLQLLRMIGMEYRERFFAGAEAGWGAQVMEHPVTGAVVFADVDLAPEEIDIDLAFTELAEREGRGTVGLWVDLHGESVLEAGLHHIALRSRFDAMRESLLAKGIASMRPFSDMEHLRQCFTEASMWKVSLPRMRTLQGSGAISDPDLERIKASGAAGSHLEIIQRGQGFKGFNQGAVSDIIRSTDPRTYNV